MRRGQPKDYNGAHKRPNSQNSKEYKENPRSFPKLGSFIFPRLTLQLPSAYGWSCCRTVNFQSSYLLASEKELLHSPESL